MDRCALIDTLPAFLSYWAEAREKWLEEQIEGWAATYMAPWLALLRMQSEDYLTQGLDWRQMVRNKSSLHTFIVERF
jgi:hypothetical protein